MTHNGYLVPGLVAGLALLIALVATGLSIWALVSVGHVKDDINAPPAFDADITSRFEAVQAKIDTFATLQTNFATLQNSVRRDRTSTTSEIATLRHAVAEHTTETPPASAGVNEDDLNEAKERITAVEQLQTQAIQKIDSLNAKLVATNANVANIDSVPPNWDYTVQRIQSLEEVAEIAQHLKVTFKIMDQQSIPLTTENFLLTLSSVEEHYDE